MEDREHFDLTGALDSAWAHDFWMRDRFVDLREMALMTRRAGRLRDHCFDAPILFVAGEVASVGRREAGFVPF